MIFIYSCHFDQAANIPTPIMLFMPRLVAIKKKIAARSPLERYYMLTPLATQRQWVSIANGNVFLVLKTTR